MHTNPSVHKALPPQEKTIPLEDAMIRTAVWRYNISKLFTPPGAGEGELPCSDIPKSIFINYEDVKQIVDDYAKAGYPISGVRVYFTLENDNLGGGYHIDGVVVPTVSVNTGISQYNQDLIIPVPLPTDTDGAATGVSIYDFTNPCPPYCEGTSPELTGSLSSEA